MLPCFTRLCSEQGPVSCNSSLSLSLGGVNRLNSKWSSQAVGQPGVLTAETQTAVLRWLRMNACYAVVHSSRGKSSSGLFYLCPPILWSVDTGETTKGGSEESERKMACGPLMSCHCPPSSLSLSLSLSLAPLFLHFLPCPSLFSQRAWDASHFPLL